MKNLGKTIPGILLVLIAILTLSSVTQAATGDLVGNVTFSQNCASGTGVGIAYDGTNLWYSCYINQTDLLRADPKTGMVSARYQLKGGLGALSYDATRNVIWAGNGGGSTSPGDVYKIELDAGKNVVNITKQFTVTGGFLSGIDDGLAFDARNLADPNDDVIYYSPDGATLIRVFNLSGNEVENFTWAGNACYNSGLAIGGNLLYEGSNGCNHVWVVDKTTKVQQFNFSTQVAGDPNFRDEDLECDTNTFAPIDVMWSKEAFSPMRAHAFEIPKGSCGIGGKPPTPGKPGKVVGWGLIGPRANPEKSFNIWTRDTNSSSGVVGQVEVTDNVNHITIKSTKLTSVMTNMMTTPKIGTITGMATVNGAGPYAFTVKVEDKADPGAGADKFTIDVSSPTPYHNSGTLSSGDITVVK